MHYRYDLKTGQPSEIITVVVYIHRQLTLQWWASSRWCWLPPCPQRRTIVSFPWSRRETAQQPGLPIATMTYQNSYEARSVEHLQSYANKYLMKMLHIIWVGYAYTVYWGRDTLHNANVMFSGTPGSHTAPGWTIWSGWMAGGLDREDEGRYQASS